MARYIAISSLLSFALLGAACGDDKATPDQQQPQPQQNQNPEPSTPKIRDVAPVLGGGISGGQLQGELTIFVLAPDGSPVKNAQIVVAASGKQLSGTSNEKGRVDLKDAALKDAIDIHVLAQNYPNHSVMALPSSVLTIQLEPLAIAAQAVQLKTVTGTVGGFDLLAPNNQERVQVVNVFGFGREVLAEADQAPRPGTVTPGDPDGTPHNVVLHGMAPFPSWDDYSLNVDQRAEGLVAFGGSFSTEQSPNLKITHMGFRKGMKLSQDSSAAMGLTLAHALDQRVELKAGVSELPVRTAQFGIALDSDGLVLPLGQMPVNGGHRAYKPAPLLVGGLAEAKYWAGLRYQSRDRVAGMSTQEVLAIKESKQLAFDFENLISAPGPASAAGRTIAARAPMGAQLMQYRLHDLTQGEQRWVVTILDPSVRSVDLPELGAAGQMMEQELLLSVEALQLEEESFDGEKFAQDKLKVLAKSYRRAMVSLEL